MEIREFAAIKLSVDAIVGRFRQVLCPAEDQLGVLLQ